MSTQEVHVIWNSTMAPADLVGWLAERMHGVKGAVAFTRPEPAEMVVSGQAIPTWAVVVAVLLFPIGLLALVAKNPWTVRITATPTESGSVLRVDGRVNGHVYQRLMALYRELGTQVSV